MNTAKWIWIDKNGPRKNCYARFFREFFIKPDEQNPTGEIRISVSDNYTLYLNGNFISCGQYKDYPDLKHYDCLKLVYFKKKKQRSRLWNFGACNTAYILFKSSVRMWVFPAYTGV